MRPPDSELLMQHPADIADELYVKPYVDTWQVLAALSDETAARTLCKLPPEYLSGLLQMEQQFLSPHRLLDLLDDRQVVDLLAVLPAPVLDDLLSTLSRAEAIEALLLLPEHSAGRIMGSQFLSATGRQSVEDVREYLRSGVALPENFADVFVVDDIGVLVGIVSFSRLLLAPDDLAMRDLCEEKPRVVSVTTDREIVANTMERYDLDLLPVVDEDGRMLGQINASDALEVMRKEVTEDIRVMSGLSPEFPASDSILSSVLVRLPWLTLGMIGSIIGATVIMEFEEALEQAAILAAFIPLVAATAGNAGIQSSTITVQTMAAGSASPRLVRRLIKEFGIALVNGLAASVLIAVFLLLVEAISPDSITADAELLLTLAASLTGVITIATMTGATMPLLLRQIKVDPAVSTGPFITVANDVVGILFYFLVADAIYL